MSNGMPGSEHRGQHWHKYKYDGVYRVFNDEDVERMRACAAGDVTVVELKHLLHASRNSLQRAFEQHALQWPQRGRPRGPSTPMQAKRMQAGDKGYADGPAIGDFDSGVYTVNSLGKGCDPYLQALHAVHGQPRTDIYPPLQRQQVRAAHTRLQVHAV